MRFVELVAALIGLVIGAVASGGVQAALGWADRDRDARSAARLLYMHLHDAQKAVRELQELQDWGRMITDWESYGTAWDTHSLQLARVLETDLFMMVSSAFGGLASLSRSRKRDTEEPAPPPGAPPNFSVRPESLDLYRFLIETADDILLSASFTRREHRQLRGKVNPETI